MTDNITRLRFLHNKLNGMAIPLESYFQHCPDCVLLVSLPDYKIQQFNRAAMELLGYTEEELYGIEIFDVFETRQSFSDKLPGRTFRFLAKIITKDKGPIELDFNSTYVVDENFMMLVGRPPAIV